MDAGDGSAAVKGSSVLIEAGGGYALGGNREDVAAVATSTLKASSSVAGAYTRSLLTSTWNPT